MSHIIFFIATLIALSIAVSAISVAIKGLSYAMNQRTEASAQQVATLVKIVDGGYDVNNNLVWVYLKNLGETTLDVNKLTVFVNGIYQGTCNDGKISCIDEDSTDYLATPGEIVEINIPYQVEPGSYRIRVVTEYGVYADYEVVVG